MNIVLGSTPRVAKDYAKSKHIDNAFIVAPCHISIESMKAISADHLYIADGCRLTVEQWDLLQSCFRDKSELRVIPCPA